MNHTRRISHLLQPLDVACFAPFKKRYGELVQDHSQSLTDEIAKLARGAEPAMQTAAILAEENAGLRVPNRRLQEKKKHQKYA